MTNAERVLPKTDKGWQTYLQNIKAPEAREWLTLGGGLSVCLEPAGTKTFQARIRRFGVDRNARRVRIGSFPAYSVAVARAELAKMKSTAKEGRDPALDARRKKAGVTAPNTVGELIQSYLARRELGELAPKTLKLERDLLEGVLAPKLGSMLVSDLAPLDIDNVVSLYRSRLKKEGRSEGTNANKLLAACRRMFRMAPGWGLLEVGVDPTRGLKKPVKETPGERILCDGVLLMGPNLRLNELGVVAAALMDDDWSRSDGKASRMALMLTLRMGFRALEVCALEWSAIDLDVGTPSLTVTRSKTKAGKRTLPLPGAAVAILADLKKSARKDAKFVFPADAGSTRAQHMHPESLSRAFARICERLKVADVSTHDLRRTCLSGLNELGYDGLAERIAGHVPVSPMAKHYDKSQRLAPMLDALEAWSAAIDGACQRLVSTAKPSSPIADRALWESGPGWKVVESRRGTK
jgi:integrase